MIYTSAFHLAHTTHNKSVCIIQIDTTSNDVQLLFLIQKNYTMGYNRAFGINFIYIYLFLKTHADHHYMDSYWLSMKWP